MNEILYVGEIVIVCVGVDAEDLGKQHIVCESMKGGGKNHIIIQEDAERVL